MSYPRGLILSVFVMLLAAAVWPATAQTPTPLTAEQIVAALASHNQTRTATLKSAQATRIYRVEYRGFSAVVSARMEVDYYYDAATGKSFRIVSASGPKFLVEKVLKRAVTSEKEASQDKAATALTAANYRFRLAGSELLEGRAAYIMDVEPIVPSKYLIRGRIWVDAAELALVKVEAEPAKSPSIWIARTQIKQYCARTNGFWLPARNRSETSVRLGGTAIFTIDYGSYRTDPGEAQ